MGYFVEDFISAIYVNWWVKIVLASCVHISCVLFVIYFWLIDRRSSFIFYVWNSFVSQSFSYFFHWSWLCKRSCKEGSLLNFELIFQLHFTNQMLCLTIFSIVCLSIHNFVLKNFLPINRLQRVEGGKNFGDKIHPVDWVYTLKLEASF